MLMDTTHVPVTAAAELAGLPRGTVAAWRHRGAVPADAFTLADTASLVLVGDLTRMGLSSAVANRIGRHCRDKWGEIATSGKRSFLFASTTETGGWTFSIRKHGDFPPPPVSGVLQADLSAIARRVLDKADRLRDRRRG